MTDFIRVCAFGNDLVGSTSFGYFRDRYDHLAIIYNKYRYGYKNENFIVWR